jgi:hypothetical protein
MRSRSFWIGVLIVVCMAGVSVAAFVETARPVQAGTAAAAPGEMVCPTGALGVPSSCAQVHAAALASGAMSRAQFDFARARLEALPAHPSSL